MSESQEEVSFEDYVSECTDEELREANEIIVEEMKRRMQAKAAKIKRKISVGSRVTVHGLRGLEDGTKAEVLEVARTRAVCSIEGRPGRYRVPISAIRLGGH